MIRTPEIKALSDRGTSLFTGMETLAASQLVRSLERAFQKEGEARVQFVRYCVNTLEELKRDQSFEFVTPRSTDPATELEACVKSAKQIEELVGSVAWGLGVESSDWYSWVLEFKCAIIAEHPVSDY